jgi:hypothetical protein
MLKFLAILLAILAGIMLLFFGGFYEFRISFDDIPVSVSVQPGVIMLTSGCTQLSMFTSEAQTMSIQSGLLGQVTRPVAHDLLAEIASYFDLEILAAKVERLEGETYYATLVVKKGNKILSLDSRPSDAIATAVRVGAPIYVNADLLEKYGKKIC